MDDMGEAEDRPWIDSDELDVLRSFASFGVRSLIVGGRAVQFHGHSRPAKDLDLFVEFSAENWTRLQVALKPLNASVPVFETLSPQRRYHARLSFYPTVELLTPIHGIGFDEAWESGIETAIEGVRVRVLAKAHLVTSKESTLRPSDADDVRALRNIDTSPASGS